MFGRIANILGWAGVALVLAGVATWLVRDDLVTLRQGFAIGGLVCILIYAASQWREMGATFAKRQARYGALAVVSVVVVLGAARRRQLPGREVQQALGPDRVARLHAVGPDAAGDRLAQGAAAPSASSAWPRTCSRSAIGWREYSYLSKQGEGRVHRPRQGSGAGPAVPDPDARHDRRRVPEARRARHQHQQRAGDHQRHHQGGAGPAAQAVLPHRPRREGSRPAADERSGYNSANAGAAARQLSPSRRWRWRSRPTCPPTPTPWSSPDRRATTCRRRSRRCAATRTRAARR